jgi:hypothetical protein
MNRVDSRINFLEGSIHCALNDNNIPNEMVKWKDFLLWFKREYASNINIREVSKQLCRVLHIDQHRDILSGIKFTYNEWLSRSQVSMIH